jgi:hypothetical protein
MGFLIFWKMLQAFNWSKSDINRLLDSGDRMSFDVFGIIMAHFNYKVTIDIEKE